MILGEKQGSIKLLDLAQEMSLGTEETMVFMRQIFPTGQGIEIYFKDNEYWVDFKSESLQYMLPLTPAEWIHLHEILSKHGATTNSEVSFSIKKKVTENGPIKVVMELLNQLELWDQELTEGQQKMVKALEIAVYEKHLMNLITIDDRPYTLRPKKILHLEGHLSLIAEDSEDNCLLVVPLKDIKNHESIRKDVRSKVSEFELDEFISAIRSMNEKETRLILKI